MKKKVDVSVILCAYNEGGIIEETIIRVDEVMMRSRWSYEIIVVDDGSLDDTRRKAVKYMEERGDGRLVVVGYEKNMGKGFAIKTGFAHSRGDFIVIMDSDLDVDPTLIPSYIEALEESDLAVASKWHPKSHTDVTLKRKVLSVGFNRLSKIFTGIKLSDTQTGLKAFRREILEKLSPKLVINRYAFDLELVGACNHNGYRIVELPVNACINSVVSFREIFRMFLDVMRVGYRLRVLKYYQRS